MSSESDAFAVVAFGKKYRGALDEIRETLGDRDGDGSEVVYNPSLWPPSTRWKGCLLRFVHKLPGIPAGTATDDDFTNWAERLLGEVAKRLPEVEMPPPELSTEQARSAIVLSLRWESAIESKTISDVSEAMRKVHKSACRNVENTDQLPKTPKQKPKRRVPKPQNEDHRLPCPFCGRPVGYGFQHRVLGYPDMTDVEVIIGEWRMSDEFPNYDSLSKDYYSDWNVCVACYGAACDALAEGGRRPEREAYQQMVANRRAEREAAAPPPKRSPRPPAAPALQHAPPSSTDAAPPVPESDRIASALTGGTAPSTRPESALSTSQALVVVAAVIVVSIAAVWLTVWYLAPGFQSPEATFLALKNAANRGDWTAWSNCMTETAVAQHCNAMVRLVASRAGELEIDDETLEEYARRCSNAEGRRAKAALISEIVPLLPPRSSIDDERLFLFSLPEDARLEMGSDSGTDRRGRITTATAEHDVEFVKVDGGPFAGGRWFIAGGKPNDMGGGDHDHEEEESTPSAHTE